MKKTEYAFYRLDVWKLSMELVNKVYSLTKQFPNEEKFALTSQIRRAAISIPLNIAEGSIRKTKKDFGHFIRTSLGSLMEVLTCIDIARNQHYISDETHQSVQPLIEKLYFKLLALNKFLLKND